VIKNVEKKCIMAGDFNLPDIDWEAGEARGADAELLEAVQAANMEQLVGFPTHVRGNTLDLILTNVPERVSNVQDIGRLGRSDHCITSFDLTLATKVRESTTVKNWSRADWQSINEGLRDTIWPTSEDNTTVEDFWQQFRTRVNDLTDLHVPSRTITAGKAGWMTNDILRLIRQKRRLWKKA
jgi:hypothetical protein